MGTCNTHFEIKKRTIMYANGSYFTVVKVVERDRSPGFSQRDFTPQNKDQGYLKQQKLDEAVEIMFRNGKHTACESGLVDQLSRHLRCEVLDDEDGLNDRMDEEESYESENTDATGEEEAEENFMDVDSEDDVFLDDDNKEQSNMQNDDKSAYHLVNFRFVIEWIYPFEFSRNFLWYW
eukprot:332394_1